MLFLLDRFGSALSLRMSTEGGTLGMDQFGSVPIFQMWLCGRRRVVNCPWCIQTQQCIHTAIMMSPTPQAFTHTKNTFLCLKRVGLASCQAKQIRFMNYIVMMGVSSSENEWVNGRRLGLPSMLWLKHKCAANYYHGVPGTISMYRESKPNRFKCQSTHK